MKAYIATKGKSPNGYFYAEVVSEQDYHERGAHAHSYRSFRKSQKAAVHDCEDWCHMNGYTVTTADEVSAG